MDHKTEETFKISFESINSSLQSPSIKTTNRDPLIETAYSERSDDTAFKLYKWRWLILLCYCLLTISGSSSWLCFTAVSNIMRKYYSISIMQVNMLSIAFGISIVVFSIPFGVLLDKYGLAVVMRLAALLNISGSIVRYFGSEQDTGYYYLLAGNILTSISIAGFLFLPGKIAASWFGAHEAGLTTSICVGFDALGSGIGFIHPTQMIHNRENVVDISLDIKKFLLSQLICSGAMFVIVMMCVRRQLKTPPNFEELEYQNHIAEEKRRLKSTDSDDVAALATESEISTTSLKSSIISLLKDYNFQLIIHMQGITAAIECVFETLLNEILIEMYPGTESAIGWLGLIAIVFGFIINIVVGVVIDRTGSSKKSSSCIFLATLLCCTSWYLLIKFVHSFMAKAAVYCLLMSCITCYYTIAFTHSAQLDLSLTPSAVGVMLVLTSQIYDPVVAIVATKTLEWFGAEGVSLFAVLLSCVAVILSLLIRKNRPQPVPV